MAVIYHRHQAASQNSKSCLSAYLCVCVSEKETEQTCVPLSVCFGLFTDYVCLTVI